MNRELVIRDGHVYEITTYPSGTVVDRYYRAVISTVGSVDKIIIKATGDDIATITATVKTYLDEPVEYTGHINFTYDGETITKQTENNSASITFSSTEPGEHRFMIQADNMTPDVVVVIVEE